MSGGHAHRLYVPGDSTVHRLPAHCKLVAVVAFVLAVVATPREQVWAFGAYVLLLAAVAAISRVPAGLVTRRMVIEVPFVAFAVLMPFVAQGERVAVAGTHLSVPGLWDMWNILAKGTLGVVASILLAATTEPRALLVGVERLRLPPLLTQIATFMMRYVDVVLDELRRMKIARTARCFEPRDVRHLAVLARSVGALFLRAYERGERVHLAMLSRGYDGRIPAAGGAADVRVSAAQWAATAALPAAAAAVAAGAWMMQWLPR